jgi:hypothetical protein
MSTFFLDLLNPELSFFHTGACSCEPILNIRHGSQHFQKLALGSRICTRKKRLHSACGTVEGARRAAAKEKRG